MIYGDFSINLFYSVYNSAKQETPDLRIFKFQGPSGTQTEQRFFWHQYFFRRKSMRRRSTREDQEGPNKHRWRRASDVVRLDLRLTGLT
jgi:hypothetical protein